MGITFKSYESAGVSSQTTILTGTAGKETIAIGMTVANTTSADITVDVKLNATYLVKQASVPTGTAFVPIGGDQKVVVEAGDTIKVTASGSSDVVLSVLERS
jgi:type IV secretory pathway VirJ component